jgi:sugar phosphate isomerase/epimerase
MYASFNARAAGLNLSAAETIELAARAGFGGVDLLVRDLVDAGEDPRALRARMDHLGLVGGGFPIPVEWRKDASLFEHGLARLPRLADAAATLGLWRAGTWVLPETPAAPAGTGEPVEAFNAVVAMHRVRLGAMARILARLGIRLGLEVIGVASARSGKGQPFVTRLADFDRVLGSLWTEAPNFGIVLDNWHLYAAGESVEAALQWGIQRVVWVHLADLPATAPRDPAAMIDSRRGLPGENGAIDAKGVLRRVSEAGYEGPVTVEPMPGCRSLAGRSAAAVADQVAASLRPLWPDSIPGVRVRGGPSAT